MDCAINARSHGNNIVDGLNAPDKRYLKEQIELLGRLASNDTSKIGILPSASKNIFITFADQCIHIINNKERLNGLKGSTRIQNRE